MNFLTDKIILLTGATSGIGRCLAIQLAAQGARLAICGRSQQKLDRLIAELESAGHPPALARAFCLSSEEAILTLPDDAVVHDLVLRPPVEDNFV